jgi:hypothetical protein
MRRSFNSRQTRLSNDGSTSNPFGRVSRYAKGVLRIGAADEANDLLRYFWCDQPRRWVQDRVEPLAPGHSPQSVPVAAERRRTAAQAF